MFKGWKLISMYTERATPNVAYFDFAHYTGRPGRHGGSEYDKTLSGHVDLDTLRKTLRRHLTLEAGNKA